MVFQTPIRPLLHSVMERAANHLIPFQASLELTYRCNLSCKHCYADVPASDELSLRELKNILDQLAESGTMYLMFTGGEPLIRPDFFDIAFYAKERGFMIMLLTNGTLIDSGVAKKVEILQPVSVGISLHGASPDTHDGITGRQGSFVSTLQGIKLLKDAGVSVSLHTLLMDSNFKEAKAIKSLAQGLGIYHRFGHEFIPARSGSLAPYRYETDLAGLYQYFESEWGRKATTKNEKKEICRAGHGICSISPTGDVFPCLLLPMIVGNLRKSSFAAIWQTNPSAELTRLRSITWQDLSVCKDCNIAEFCRICIGIAWTETGELTRPSPSACRIAALKSELLKRKGVVA